MKNLRTKSLIIFVLFISLPFSTFAESASSRKPKSTEVNKIQNTQKAFEYFEIELESIQRFKAILSYLWCKLDLSIKLFIDATASINYVEAR